MRGLLSIIAVALVLAGCEADGPTPADTLPAVAGAPYQLSLVTYDKGYCDNPFALYIKAKQSAPVDEKPYELLRAGPMCKNVDIIQTPDRLYIFYEVLSLRYFNNKAVSDPHQILCDLALPACRDERARLLAAGGKAYNVCTCRVPESPEVIEPFPTKESAK
jgi:hypothetical protein